MRNRKKRFSAFEIVLYALCAVWIIYQVAVPAVLGFSPAEKAKWGPIDAAPEILSRWYMRTNNIGRISWCDSDGWHVVITQDGKIIAGDAGDIESMRKEWGRDQTDFLFSRYE